MARGWRNGDLPFDVASNVASCLLDNPKYLRLKRNNAFEQIQQKHRPRSYGLEIHMDFYRDHDTDFENLHFEIEAKVENMSYVLDPFWNELNISKT